jgi:hypothetical protein
MFTRIARASLIATALAFAAGPVAVLAQTAAPATPKVEAPAQPKAPVVQKAKKTAPGLACANLQSNTQAHKDCLAKNAHAKNDGTKKDGAKKDSTAAKKTEDAKKS